MSKKVTQNSQITTTAYLTGFQYKNAVLQFFPHAEGYVNATQSGTSYTFHYVFNYTDHLGNIRLSYTKDPTSAALKVIEETHYYPFGLKHTNYNSDRLAYIREGATLKVMPVPPLFKTIYNYKYNGKELQEELGLNMYDYGARNYDPSIGKFLAHDPYSAKYAGISPYSYCYDNPVLFIDPFGMWITINDGSNTYRYHNGTTQHQVDGNWVDIDENVKLSNFTAMTIASLYHLENGGPEGKKLIDHFSNDENNAEIYYERGTAGEANDGGCIPLDHRAGSDATVTTTKSGMQDSPLFVTIAHELGHLKDPENDKYTIFDNWMGVSKGEIYACHVENLIRAEHELAVRVSYVVKTKNKIYPGLDVSTVLIDCSGNSLYYKPNGELYKWKRDGDRVDIAKAYNSLTGRDASNVLTGRFNYYENAKKNKK